MKLRWILLGAVVLLGVISYAVIRGRSLASNADCPTNLKIIEGAKQAWLVENATRFKRLPTWADLEQSKYLGLIPKCPEGGQYQLGNEDTLASCSIQKHQDQWLKLNPRK